MDQNAVVTEQVASGQRLIDALELHGFHVEIAFWAKPAEGDKWYLFLASPEVDAQGSLSTYGKVFEILRSLQDNWLEPLDIKVVGMADSITKGAEAVVKPRVPNGQFAVPHPKRYSGMTRFGGSTLGGIEVDGEVLIYPPFVPSNPA